MSSHADTIRRRLRQFEGSEAYKHAEARQGNALDALDALLAENQRLRAVREAADRLTLGGLGSKGEWTSVRSGDFNALLEALAGDAE